MAYQPVLHATDGSLFGHEALVRTREAALPDPSSLIDAAERLGRLDQLGQLTRKLAVGDGAPHLGCLLINLHPADLADPELYRADTSLGRNAGRVVLEITERASLEGRKDVRRRVEELRALGYRIAVDDLGSGYAGLTSFAQLEPEIVKLDMALVRGVAESPLKQKLIGSITRVCKDMGILVVAEGIETTTERDSVVDLGCDLLQGFLLGRPGPVGDRRGRPPVA